MTRLDDETLMRRVDGELSLTEAARVDAVAAADPATAARMSAMRGTRKAATEAFPATADARDRDLARMIGAPTASRPSVAAGFGRMLADAFAPRRAVIWGGLAAAAFVGGLALGPMLGGRSDVVTVQSGAVLADAGLVRVLDTRLSTQGPDEKGRAVGLTFRDDDGRWCRTFEAAEQGVAGLACQAAGGWAMQVMSPVSAEHGEIRTAATDTPEAVLAAVDAAIAGETLDAAAEAAARDGGWR